MHEDLICKLKGVSSNNYKFWNKDYKNKTLELYIIHGRPIQILKISFFFNLKKSLLRNTFLNSK